MGERILGVHSVRLFSMMLPPCRRVIV